MANFTSFCVISVVSKSVNKIGVDKINKKSYYKNDNAQFIYNGEIYMRSLNKKTRLIIILIIVIEVLAIATVSIIYALKFNKYKKQSGYDSIINEHIAQLKEEEDKRVKIIKKFYPKEYEEILEESKKEQDTGIVEWTKSPLKNYEKRLYDLTLRILEEEKLTDDEYELLKEDIKISMDSIEKDEGLLKRAEKILDNEKTK